MAKKVIRIKIFEDAAVVPADVNTTANDAAQQSSDNQKQNQTNTANTTKPPFTAADVENMDADQVLDYVYLNPPEGIDDATKNALYVKVAKIGRDRNNGMMTPKEIEEMGKNAIANAQRMLQNKTAYNLK